jgi:hypothetical protein
MYFVQSKLNCPHFHGYISNKPEIETQDFRTKKLAMDFMKATSVDDLECYDNKMGKLRAFKRDGQVWTDKR